MCFKEETTIDFFEKHNQTKFRERIVKLKGHKVNLFSAIFGANASGKSSIMKALMLLKNMVDGRSLSYNPYRLDGNSENTVFEIVFSIKEDIFLFKISYNNNQVENEELWYLSSKKTDYCIYNRSFCKETSVYNIYFNNNSNNIKSHKWFFNNETCNELMLFNNGTKKNKLFINNTINQNRTEFKEIYDWFERKLILLTPDDTLPFIFNFIDDKKSDSFCKILTELNTGITSIGKKELKDFPVDLKNDIKESLKESDLNNTYIPYNNFLRIEIEKSGENVFVHELITRHSSNNKNYDFKLHEESDGTNRLLDILPMLYLLIHTNEELTLFLDEIDRSLHSALVRNIIDIFFQNILTKNNNSQLIITTHDVQLLDLKFLRKDEIWIFDREGNNTPVLRNLGLFKDIRHDVKIKKKYLLGRLSYTPSIDSCIFFDQSNSELSKELSDDNKKE